MNHAISVELQFFLISVLWGSILLLVYDSQRIFRRLIKHDSFFIALEDLAFWVAASLFIFAMMYRENNGIIRGFSVMGMSIGMVLYHYILSDFLVNMITKLIRTLISPISFAMNGVKRFIKFVWSREKKVLNFIIRRLKKRTKSVKIALIKRRQASAAKKQKRTEKKMLVKEERDRKNQERKGLNSKKHNNKKRNNKKQNNNRHNSKSHNNKKKNLKKQNSKSQNNKNQSNKY